MRMKHKKHITNALSPQPLYNLARMLLISSMDVNGDALPVNQLDKTSKLFQEAIGLAPTDSQFHYFMAVTHEKQKLIEKAAEEYLLAITLKEKQNPKDPKFIKARIALSKIYFKNKQFELSYKYIEPIRKNVTKEYLDILEKLNEIPSIPPESKEK